MSISTKSSNNGHRTAADDHQQEHLSFAHLDESEEQLQMLRHKIAELERQQSMNSPTSSDGFDLVAQNENELEDADGTLGDQNEFEEAKNHREKEAKIAAAEFARYHEKITNMELELKQFREELKDMKQYKEELKDMKQYKEELKAVKEEMKNTKESVSKKLEQMEEWKRVAKLELENKALRAELEHQKLVKDHKDPISEIKQLNTEDLKQQQNQTERIVSIDQLGRFNGFEQKQTANSEQQKTDQKALIAPIDQMGLKETADVHAVFKFIQLLKIRTKFQLQHGMSQLKGELIAKMEEYQNKQQQTIDSLTEAQKGNVLFWALNALKALREKLGQNHQTAAEQKADQMELIVIEQLVQNQKSNAQKAMLTQMAQLEEYQKKQKQKQTLAHALMEGMKINNALIPQNRWNVAACHEALTFTEPNRLIVQHKENAFAVYCSALAEWPIPKEHCGIFYFEVQILKGNGYIFVGFGTKQMPLDKSVGDYYGTYAYDSWGTLKGHHAVEGCDFDLYGRPYIVKGIPEFGAGDVVGCGVNLATRQIFYTKNGELLLGAANLFVNSVADLFPSVTLYGPRDKIEANFGQTKFAFKF